MNATITADNIFRRSSIDAAVFSFGTFKKVQS